MSIKAFVRAVAPPVALSLARRLRTSRSSWEEVDSFDYPARGWDVADVAEAYRRKWPAFVAHVANGGVLGVPPDGHDMDSFDLAFHNTVMSFAHALGRARGARADLRMLDWGCALGHYRVMAQRLYPDLRLDYTGCDLPPMVAVARDVQPGATFFDDERGLGRRYDFVMASTSMHYAKDWRAMARRLAAACEGFLYLAGVPTVEQTPSFPFVQRAFSYGYNTEYVGWCLNRAELMATLRGAEATLVHEYDLGYRPRIDGAAEQCVYRGFLFQVQTQQ